ncbi:MAG: EscR/YscR/HrcR family type III secretion system export apparatus protein, partial [Deltaproteobacteria bacterium]|nr:EscR/YscR/HrcR family type III secretion system export apparatus protein [Deltaproteobacteria bacterium]
MQSAPVSPGPLRPVPSPPLPPCPAPSGVPGGEAAPPPASPRPAAGIPAVLLLAMLAVSTFLAAAPPASAQTAVGEGNTVPIPTVTINMGESGDPDRIATVINVMFILTVLALAPSLLIMLTSFVRIVVIFGFMRQAMGTQQTPPNQVLVSLALFMTFY